MKSRAILLTITLSLLVLIPSSTAQNACTTTLPDQYLERGCDSLACADPQEAPGILPSCGAIACGEPGAQANTQCTCDAQESTCAFEETACAAGFTQASCESVTRMEQTQVLYEYEVLLNDQQTLVLNVQQGNAQAVDTGFSQEDSARYIQSPGSWERRHLAIPPTTGSEVKHLFFTADQAFSTANTAEGYRSQTYQYTNLGESETVVAIIERVAPQIEEAATVSIVLLDTLTNQYKTATADIYPARQEITLSQSQPLDFELETQDIQVPAINLQAFNLQDITQDPILKELIEGNSQSTTMEQAVNAVAGMQLSESYLQWVQTIEENINQKVGEDNNLERIIKIQIPTPDSAISNQVNQPFASTGFQNILADKTREAIEDPHNRVTIEVVEEANQQIQVEIDQEATNKRNIMWSREGDLLKANENPLETAWRNIAIALQAQQIALENAKYPIAGDVRELSVELDKRNVDGERSYWVEDIFALPTVRDPEEFIPEEAWSICAPTGESQATRGYEISQAYANVFAVVINEETGNYGIAEMHQIDTFNCFFMFENSVFYGDTEGNLQVFVFAQVPREYQLTDNLRAIPTQQQLEDGSYWTNFFSFQQAQRIQGSEQENPESTTEEDAEPEIQDNSIRLQLRIQESSETALSGCFPNAENVCQTDACALAGGNYFRTSVVGSSCTGDLSETEEKILQEVNGEQYLCCIIPEERSCGQQGQEPCIDGCSPGLSHCEENRDVTCQESCGSTNQIEDPQTPKAPTSTTPKEKPVIEEIILEDDSPRQSATPQNNEKRLRLVFSNLHRGDSLSVDVMLRDIDTNVAEIIESRVFKPSQLKLEEDKYVARIGLQLEDIAPGEYKLEIQTKTLSPDLTVREHSDTVSRPWYYSNPEQGVIVVSPSEEVLADPELHAELEALAPEQGEIDAGSDFRNQARVDEDTLRALQEIQKARIDFQRDARAQGDYYDAIVELVALRSEDADTTRIEMGSLEAARQREIVENFDSNLDAEILGVHTALWQDTFITAEAAARAIREPAEGFWDSVRNFGSDAWNGYGNPGPAAVQYITEYTDDGPQKIESIVSGTTAPRSVFADLVQLPDDTASVLRHNMDYLAQTKNALCGFSTTDASNTLFDTSTQFPGQRGASEGHIEACNILYFSMVDLHEAYQKIYRGTGQERYFDQRTQYLQDLRGEVSRIDQAAFANNLQFTFLAGFGAGTYISGARWLASTTRLAQAGRVGLVFVGAAGGLADVAYLRHECFAKDEILARVPGTLVRDPADYDRPGIPDCVEAVTLTAMFGLPIGGGVAANAMDIPAIRAGRLADDLALPAWRGSVTRNVVDGTGNLVRRAAAQTRLAAYGYYHASNAVDWLRSSIRAADMMPAQVRSVIKRFSDRAFTRNIGRDASFQDLVVRTGSQEDFDALEPEMQKRVYSAVRSMAEKAQTATARATDINGRQLPEDAQIAALEDVQNEIYTIYRDFNQNGQPPYGARKITERANQELRSDIDSLIEDAITYQEQARRASRHTDRVANEVVEEPPEAAARVPGAATRGFLGGKSASRRVGFVETNGDVKDFDRVLTVEDEDIMILSLADGVSDSDGATAAEYLHTELADRMISYVLNNEGNYHQINDLLVERVTSISQRVHDGTSATFITSAVTADGKLLTFRTGDTELRIIRNGEIYHTDNLYYSKGMAFELGDSEPLFNGRFLQPEFELGSEIQAFNRNANPPAQVDPDNPSMFRPRMTVHQLESGDRIVMTSDGLSKTLDEEDFLSIISQSDDYENAISNLIQVHSERSLVHPKWPNLYQDDLSVAIYEVP